jgi:chromosome segregation ATPase
MSTIEVEALAKAFDAGFSGFDSENECEAAMHKAAALLRSQADRIAALEMRNAGVQAHLAEKERQHREHVTMLEVRIAELERERDEARQKCAELRDRLTNAVLTRTALQRSLARAERERDEREAARVAHAACQTAMIDALQRSLTEAVEALSDIARQKLATEMEDVPAPDWQGGYEACVRRARSIARRHPRRHK